jgi:hypothetical protein
MFLIDLLTFLFGQTQYEVWEECRVFFILKYMVYILTAVL